MTRRPQVGDRAVDFALVDQHGVEVALSSSRGSSAVLIVFYPYAFSRVCSGELQQLRDHQEELHGEVVRLLAISCDPMFSLRAFADAEGIAFSLLSDYWPHGAVAQSYGVFDDARGCARRASFLVDDEGVLRWQVEVPMGEARSLDEYRAAISELTTSPAPPGRAGLDPAS